MQPTSKVAYNFDSQEGQIHVLELKPIGFSIITSDDECDTIANVKKIQSAIDKLRREEDLSLRRKAVRTLETYSVQLQTHLGNTSGWLSSLFGSNGVDLSSVLTKLKKFEQYRTDSISAAKKYLEKELQSKNGKVIDLIKLGNALATVSSHQLEEPPFIEGKRIFVATIIDILKGKHYVNDKSLQKSIGLLLEIDPSLDVIYTLLKQEPQLPDDHIETIVKHLNTLVKEDGLTVASTRLIKNLGFTFTQFLNSNTISASHALYLTFLVHEVFPVDGEIAVEKIRDAIQTQKLSSECIPLFIEYCKEYLTLHTKKSDARTTLKAIIERYDIINVKSPLHINPDEAFKAAFIIEHEVVKVATLRDRVFDIIQKNQIELLKTDETKLPYALFVHGKEKTFTVITNHDLGLGHYKITTTGITTAVERASNVATDVPAFQITKEPISEEQKKDFDLELKAVESLIGIEGLLQLKCGLMHDIKNNTYQFWSLSDLFDGDLHSILFNKKPYAFPKGLISQLQVALQLMQGINELHAEKWIHGDIKLENCFFKKQDVIVRLGDFGKCYDKEHFEDSEMNCDKAYGTTKYNAPELITTTKGLTFKDGVKADTYALGLVLWTLLKGSFPLFIKEMEKFYNKEGQREKYDSAKYETLNKALNTQVVDEHEKLKGRKNLSLSEKYELQLLKLLHPNPSKRPTLKQSLKTIQKLLEEETKRAEKQDIANE